MGSWLPGKYDRNWVNVWLIATVIFWVFWNGSQFLILHKHPSSSELLGILFLSMASTLTFCIAGYFRLKILWYSSLAGIGVGLCLKLVFYFRGGGWEDLAGLVAYVEFATLGTLIGMVGETVRLILCKRRK